MRSVSIASKYIEHSIYMLWMHEWQIYTHRLKNIWIFFKKFHSTISNVVFFIGSLKNHGKNGSVISGLSAAMLLVQRCNFLIEPSVSLPRFTYQLFLYSGRVMDGMWNCSGISREILCLVNNHFINWIVRVVREILFARE